MRRIRNRRRALRSACFCDGCANVVHCDGAAKLEQIRRREVLRHAGLGHR